MLHFPKILLVGGPDVDARLDLMMALNGRFEIAAAGTDACIRDCFESIGYRYYPYPMSRTVNPLVDLRSFISLFLLFLHQKPSLVHAFDTKPCILARLAAKLARVPVIVGTLPGLGTLYVHDDFYSHFLRFIYEPLQKLASGVSDLTVFQNPNDRQIFIERGIVSEKRTKVILGSGVLTGQYDTVKYTKADRHRIRRDLKISQDSILVTMISRLIRSKGVLDFAAAANNLQSSERCIFLLVGPSDDASMDRLTSSEIEFISESVRWLGARSDVPDILAASDIFVLPTYYREGIPRALLEAASMGLPIITTDVPGCKMIVEDKVNGILVSPKNPDQIAQAILMLISDDELRGRFRIASRHRAVTEFDLSVIARETASVYLDLLAEKGQM